MGETPWVLRAIDAHTNHMKIIVTENSFIEAFTACGRGSQFSSPALRALFAHLENMEEDLDVETILDPIGTCCEWSEYSTALEGATAFGFKDGIDSKDETPLDWLENRTRVVQFEGGVVVLNF